MLADAHATVRAYVIGLDAHLQLEYMLGKRLRVRVRPALDTEQVRAR